MKKMVLLFTMLLMGLTTVTASEKYSVKTSNDLDITSRYRYAQPILFVERGVEFLIFADGSFDFNTDIFYAPRRDVYYKNRRNRRSGSIGAPGHVYTRSNRGTLVRHDRLGRVRRVGNVFINYDRFGRIIRAGSVYMDYRRGLLRQVGNLRVQYNRRGFMVGTRGQVNFNNPGHGIYGFNDFESGRFSNNPRGQRNQRWNDDWDDDDWDEDWDDDHYYYYKKNGKIKKQKKLNFKNSD
ncbi:hypothetical protein [Winogradskyella poriferorum]|uniref:hypothetical protein n=1 Tax=Winogradskyella poriferorum TaxID=307627 RepID=UPI003D64EFFF